jgi:hypothetical protein
MSFFKKFNIINEKTLEKSTLPSTIIVDDNVRSFPNNPARLNKKTAK